LRTALQKRFGTVSAGRKKTVESVDYSMGGSGHFDTPDFKEFGRIGNRK